MNITTSNNTKSDYRIADSQLPLQQIHIQNDTLLDTNNNSDTSSNTNISSSSSLNNNFNNGNLANNPNNSLNSRFATSQLSPSLEDFTNTVSIASLNVRDINFLTKFDIIFEDLMCCSFSAIGLQKTKIKEFTRILLY